MEKKSQQTWISLLNNMTKIVRIGQHNKRHAMKSYKAKCKINKKWWMTKSRKNQF